MSFRILGDKYRHTHEFRATLLQVLASCIVDPSISVRVGSEWLSEPVETSRFKATRRDDLVTLEVVGYKTPILEFFEVLGIPTRLDLLVKEDYLTVPKSSTIPNEYFLLLLDTTLSDRTHLKESLKHLYIYGPGQYEIPPVLAPYQEYNTSVGEATLLKLRQVADANDIRSFSFVVHNWRNPHWYYLYGDPRETDLMRLVSEAERSLSMAFYPLSDSAHAEGGFYMQPYHRTPISHLLSYVGTFIAENTHDGRVCLGSQRGVDCYYGKATTPYHRKNNCMVDQMASLLECFKRAGFHVKCNQP